MADTTSSSPQPSEVSWLQPFVFDLAAHEIHRVTSFMNAMPDWDPAAVLAAEVEAHTLLYSDLSTEQRSLYDLLYEEGVLMLDADAYLGRRAWLPCPRCREDGCINCAVNLPCDQHWRYLLANEGWSVFLQCPSCMHRWWHDTGTITGNNPPDPFSTHRDEAA